MQDRIKYGDYRRPPIIENKKNIVTLCGIL